MEHRDTVADERKRLLETRLQSVGQRGTGAGSATLHPPLITLSHRSAQYRLAGIIKYKNFNYAPLCVC